MDRGSQIDMDHSDDVPNNSAITVPFFAPEVERTGSMFDWNYTTVSQPALGGRALPYPRGFALGGTGTTSKHQAQVHLVKH